jgi:hypothetical protein
MVNSSRHEIPFYLKRYQKPDLIKLYVVVEGQGPVWPRLGAVRCMHLLDSDHNCGPTSLTSWSPPAAEVFRKGRPKFAAETLKKYEVSKLESYLLPC